MCVSNRSIQAPAGVDRTGTVDEVAAMERTLYTYNTTVDTNGTTLPDYNAVIEEWPYFDATSRPWYTSGASCGMMPSQGDLKYGWTCASKIFISAASPGSDVVDLRLSITQPFFDSNGTVKGVMTTGILLGDTSYASISAFMKRTSLESSQYTVVERRGMHLIQITDSELVTLCCVWLGEVVQSSDDVISFEGSEGQGARLSVLLSPLEDVSAFATSLWGSFDGNFTAAQNQSSLGGYKLESTSSMASWKSVGKYDPQYMGNAICSVLPCPEPTLWL